jgi:hypothetical protein
LHRISRVIEFTRSISANRVISEECDKTQIAILLRGGIGDVMIAARWLHRLIPRIRSGGDFVIDIYYALPDNIVFIFGNFDCVRYIYHDITFDYVSRYYSLALAINHLGFLELKKASLDDLSVNRPLSEMLGSWSTGIGDFKKFTNEDYHPKLGAGFAHFIQAHGFTRQDILRAQTGEPVPVSPFPFFFSEGDALPDHGILHSPYMTIHDGWDSQLMLGSRRPTKSYPREKWASLVSEIKHRFPRLGIVQVGGGTGAEIPGVDLSLKDSIPLSRAARVLQRSLLHLDTDSGLVHIAASLGTKALVLFGPTDISYYGYPQNMNVNAPGCNNCWLSSGSWITTCLIGDVVPRCMESISQERILNAMEQALSATHAN